MRCLPVLLRQSILANFRNDQTYQSRTPGKKRRHVLHQFCLERSAVTGRSKRNGLQKVKAPTRRETSRDHCREHRTLEALPIAQGQKTTCNRPGQHPARQRMVDQRMRPAREGWHLLLCKYDADGRSRICHPLKILVPRQRLILRLFNAHVGFIVVQTAAIECPTFSPRAIARR